jgi:crotonobetaine/carnitine-CoA ligase
MHLSSDAAMIMYTSGTTGVPKGAVYSHHFLYMYSALSADAFEWSPSDVLFTTLPLYHAAALNHVAMAALHTGATACLRSKFSVGHFWEQARDSRATFAVLMGPMAAMIASRIPATDEHFVSKLFCTPPPPDLIGFERKYSVRVFWQTYGMTEIYAAPMIDRHDDRDSPDLVGRPGQWIDFGVSNDAGELLGPGELGELVFRPRIPRMMMDGYFRRPGETAAAFRGLVFHTGDLGYYDEDGALHFVGRFADRVRRRGENVPVVELEQLALRHPGVEAVAAYGVPSVLGEDDIKIDVSGRDVNLAALRSWLEANLPALMWPRYYEVRQGFPTTPSERVRKAELRRDGVDRPTVLDVEGSRG